MKIDESLYRLLAKFVHTFFMEGKVQSFFGHMQIGLYYRINGRG